MEFKSYLRSRRTVESLIRSTEISVVHNLVNRDERTVDASAYLELFAVISIIYDFFPLMFKSSRLTV